MTTFTKENEGKTFIIGQRLSWRQSKARAQVADSYRHVELTFIKITDKSVVYEVTIYGITHKVKSMIQMYSDSVSGTHRYIKFTKKAVWGIFHGTIAYEVGFIEKEDEESCSKCDAKVPKNWVGEEWVECVQTGWYCPEHSPTTNCSPYDECACCNPDGPEEEDFGTECQLGNSASCGCPSCVEKYKSDEEDEDEEEEAHVEVSILEENCGSCGEKVGEKNICDTCNECCDPSKPSRCCECE